MTSRTWWVRGLILVASLIGVVLLGVVILGALVMRGLNESVLIESRGPVDVAEARRRLPFDYPDSAHDVQFGYFEQFVAFEMFVRFEAPADECRAVAERVIARYNAAHPDRKVSGLAPIHRSAPIDEPSIKCSQFSTDWFDVGTIRTGLAGGGSGSHAPKVWVDSERGIFYYLLTD